MKVVDTPAPKGSQGPGNAEPRPTPTEAGPEAAHPSDKRPRRPYAPPAIESAGGFAPITLGTKPSVMPGRGC
jgi:hypothetical protein